ncbi:asparagine synthase (glutamine-hydrolyzing) [Niveibacterium sp.]|uniref:asparagine synthase (glutamine-hydrolyzing) n=1 Tax=Niveibacterium sp. TaxID=2017444 RepID=UPI0035B15F00
MCGIAGVLNIDGRLNKEELRTLARKMAGMMAYRGPDDEGVWVDEDAFCALSHRRLSIIDVSSAGHQPMLSVDAQKALVFNGELYNFQELKRDAEARGQAFRSHSDTEVFLAGLLQEGPYFLTRVDAMFAIGYYDEQRRELLLARDAFGEKPLYYTHQNGLFAFASELHALTALPGFDASISADTIAEYLAFQHIPAPDTIYTRCNKLEHGHYMRVGRRGAQAQTAYHHFVASGLETGDRTLDDAADELEDLMLTALRRRLISDVPLGAFLSAGIDSSTAVALMTKRLNRSINTFSIGFKDTVDTEHLEAREMAQHLGTTHHDEVIDPARYGEYADIGIQMDEPNLDSSCVPTKAISELARRHVTVAITGDGGDEMFGGYTRYFACIDMMKGREEDIAKRRWHLGKQYYPHMAITLGDSHLTSVFGYVPNGAADMMLERARRIDLDPRPALARLREADLRSYLPVVLAKVDRMSMLHSLECRTPYLSVDVARFAAGLPNDLLREGHKGKLVLRRVAERYIPKAWLERPKRGFGLEPMHSPARQAVISRLSSLVGESDYCLRHWIPPATMDTLIRERFPVWGFYNAWAFLILELWLRHHPHRPA